jgi:hypothetical protein
LDLAPCLSFDQEMLIGCIKTALKLRKSVIFLQSFWTSWSFEDKVPTDLCARFSADLPPL